MRNLIDNITNFVTINNRIGNSIFCSFGRITIRGSILSEEDMG